MEDARRGATGPRPQQPAKKRLDVNVIPVDPGIPDERMKRAVFLDAETTGLDVRDDEVVELAMIAFEYDEATGKIGGVGPTFSKLREPKVPISPAAARIHKITWEMVAGHEISQDEVNTFLRDDDLVIAHNAEFDRAMVEKVWPKFKQVKWACSMRDIGWKTSYGFASQKLEYLVNHVGYVYNPHRAYQDALAGVALMASPLPTGERTLAVLAASAQKPRTLICVTLMQHTMNKVTLIKRGFFWNSTHKLWSRLTDNQQTECAWWLKKVHADKIRIAEGLGATIQYSPRMYASLPPPMCCSSVSRSAPPQRSDLRAYYHKRRKIA